MLLVLFALFWMQISVAVLMAVGFQLSCFLLRDIAAKTISHLIVNNWFMRDDALDCNRVQNEDF